ncbi:hypothetical protein MKW94_000856, partial [Papaver nudicaule]|nr:hypothetical protein [Papaver nudicaule]
NGLVRSETSNILLMGNTYMELMPRFIGNRLELYLWITEFPEVQFKGRINRVLSCLCTPWSGASSHDDLS